METMEHSLLFFLTLGVYHGINPGMGWLFSVSIAMQKESTRKIFTSQIPIAVGHLASLIVTLAIFETLKNIIPIHYTKIFFASVLIIFGAYKIYDRAHMNWVKMNVGNIDLVIWSFLMASSHGAGLMLIPGFNTQSGHHSVIHIFKSGLLPLVSHMAGMIIISTTIAYFVYKVIGLRILRTAWVNFDYLWSYALIIGGLFIFFS